MAQHHHTGSSGSVVLQFYPISFDSAKPPMLKSAELLGFSSHSCPRYLAEF